MTIFRTKELDIELSGEKLIAKTESSNESFSLKSINSIGIIDLVEEFEKAQTVFKTSKLLRKILFSFGTFFVLSGIGVILKLDLFLGLGIMVFSSIFFVLGFLVKKQNKVEPHLKSAIRISIHGTNRDLVFLKSPENNDKVSELISVIENELLI
ncbi:MAG: hypothetical protein K9G36_01950 [Crocinitomicaceae bacterium]|nr:hypothetical protein [Crocinitomicaceae bacterium]MCF8444441.1 hypothetical protein [Crocinitomicaceae bacterium]